jgi:hypothetical protein
MAEVVTLGREVPDIEHFAQQFLSKLRKGAEAWIEAGKVLINAKRSLAEHGQWTKLIKGRLGMHMSTAERFIQIASDPIISNPAHVQLLPPHWSSIVELKKLGPQKLEAAIKSGQINATMQRKDIIALRGDKPKQPAPKTIKPSRVTPHIQEAQSDDDKFLVAFDMFRELLNSPNLKPPADYVSDDDLFEVSEFLLALRDSRKRELKSTKSKPH